jgi:hypothetical protein
MASFANMGAFEFPVRAVLEEDAEVGIVDADAVADSVKNGLHPELFLLEEAHLLVQRCRRGNGMAATGEDALVVKGEKDPCR